MTDATRNLLEQHFDTAFAAPDGIARLRELILTLAMQGKLVEQDPNDPPTSELLKEIEREKKRASHEGTKTRRGKEKKLPPIKPEEVPYQLPQGWEWVKIREICHDWGQKTPDAMFTYIDVGAIENYSGTISSNTQLLDASDAPSRARKIVKAGTIIYSTVRPYLLNIAIVEKEYEPEPIASTAFAILHPFGSLSARFIYYYLRSPSFIRYVESTQKGVAYPAINDGDFFSGLFPLPPLPEQHRIVARIDQLMARCDALEKLRKERELKRLAVHAAAIHQLLDPTLRAFVPSCEPFAFLSQHFGELYTVKENVAELLKAMLELVKEKNFDKLGQWLEFCAWVLSNPDTARVEGQPEPRDESRDHPDWGSSRRAVVDFIDACVNKDTDAPISARNGLAALLRHACGQSDWRLDHDRPVILNRDDPITEAINNTRSRALESLVNFGFWVRRQLPEDQLPEVTDILAERLTENAEIPLTRPEQALLGMHFENLCTLNRDWAAQQREILFPQANETVWWDAFGSYIRFNRPVKLTFEILRGEFEYAIENLNILAAEKGDGKELVDRLGQHLFTYYLWEVYPLTGDESLLERFYDKTNDDRKRWGQLFDHVGRSLKGSGRHLDKTLTDRIIAFFEWRLKAAEPLELQEFTFWLEAECLGSDWRLQSYSKILDLVQGKDVGLSHEVSALNKLVPNHLALVVECFAKITDALDQDTQMYISADEAKPILKGGLTAEDPLVRENAERARENLLRLGGSDYLEVE